MKSYTVDRLHDPQPDSLHRRYVSLEEAKKEAASISARSPEEVIAVWDEKFVIVTIFTAGLEFKPV